MRFSLRQLFKTVTVCSLVLAAVVWIARNLPSPRHDFIVGVLVLSLIALSPITLIIVIAEFKDWRNRKK